MPGNLHVRFGEGDAETCPGNGVKRFIPTLRPVGHKRGGGMRPQPHAASADVAACGPGSRSASR